MTKLTIDLPDDVFSALRKAPKEFGEQMRLAAAIHWYSQRLISQEKAANIAGISRTAFLMELARAKVDAFHVDFDDLQEELDRA